jgi:hypothetical protein
MPNAEKACWRNPAGLFLCLDARLPARGDDDLRSASGAWTIANHVFLARYNHEATLLTDGRVLVTGGFDIGVSVSHDRFSGGPQSAK